MSDVYRIAPEIGLTLLALLVMFLDALRVSRRVLPWLSFFGLLAALAALPLFSAPASLFHGLIVVDPLAVFLKGLSLLSIAIVVLLSISHRPLIGFHEGEYHTVLLLLAVALLFLVGADHLLMIYLGIEMVSLCSYILTGHLKRDPRSSEAALKYFLFGALCSGLFLYGATIAYGLSGTLDLAEMVGRFRAMPLSLAAWLALLLMLVGLGFKIAMVPFHSWAPDAYEGAPTPITAMLSVSSKAGGFAVLLRVLMMVFPAWPEHVAPLMWLLCVVTMTIGNIVAVRQTNIKRLLAYSSIAQAGYVLIGLTVMGVSPEFRQMGAQAALFYLLAYLFMNLGAFAVVIVVSNALGSDDIADYRGLAVRAPLAAASLAIFLLSLTGIPPLAGFVGKFYLFSAAIAAHAYALAVIAGLNTVVAAFYYFRIVRAMYLDAARETTPLSAAAAPLQVAVVLSLAGTVIVGLWPTLFLTLPLGVPWAAL